jgi:hypothetical protein
MNEIQKRFEGLCKLGGGAGGGPARGKVQELLAEGGQRLNVGAFSQTAHAIKLEPSANPWHVLFAVGLGWGHLAVLDDDFVHQAVHFLSTGDAISLDAASRHHIERGPDPLRASLASAKTLFDNVRLPKAIPTTLEGIKSAQDRWLGRLIGPQRPAYIGSWNATAMFMVAGFAQPKLAATMRDNAFILPPGGPIWVALRKLYQAHVLPHGPSGSDLDDGDWEPGVLFENNALMATIVKGAPALNMIDLHSGLYLLGTNHPHADSWI